MSQNSNLTQELEFLRKITFETLNLEMYSEYIFLRMLMRNFAEGLDIQEAVRRTLPHHRSPFTPPDMSGLIRKSLETPKDGAPENDQI